MSTQTQDRDQLVQKAIGEISHIATLPEITLKIIELVEDPTSTAQDLHKLISYDPALCSRILKVVNSSFYGLPGQIASINRAIVMLGLNAVKNIAIAASLAKLFRGGQLTPNFSARDLWLHSIACATTTKLLADKLNIGLSDEAFLAGLMHDIGIMVEMQFDRGLLIETIDAVGADSDGIPVVCMLEAEEKIFGADHTDFGFGLCKAWKFPESLATVTKYHHDPLSLPTSNRTLSSLVYIADRVTAELFDSFRMDMTSLKIDPAVMEEVKLTPEALAEIKETLPEHLESTTNSLG